MNQQTTPEELREERERLVYNYLEAHENEKLDAKQAARALALFDEKHPALKA